MIKEHESVVQTADLPEHGLRSGDIGTVVMVHQGGAGYEVEFMTLDGETVAVVSLYASQLRSISSKEIAHARAIEAVWSHFRPSNQIQRRLSARGRYGGFRG
jgi:hypothetical protein